MVLPSELLDIHRRLGARVEAGRITGYSTLEKEDAALHVGCALFDRSDRGKLCLTGSERIGFLQGLCTHDVKSLAPGRGCYTAVLEPKGHLVADARVLVREDDVLLDVEPGREKILLDHLERHLISEDVEIRDVTSSFALFSLLGPRSSEVALDEHHFEVQGDLLRIGTRLGALKGIDLLVPSSQAAKVFEATLASGAVPVGFEALEIARVEAGIPRFGADMDEDTVALEANLAERAISFTKGCYVGQEVIARASYHGGVRHKLVGLRLAPGPLPASGAPLFKAAGDEKPIGRITTSVHSPRLGDIALGYARREVQASGTELVTGDGRKVVVCALPF
jgi:folate-binding protein YgfZ